MTQKTKRAVPRGFSEEEKRLRRRIVDMGIRQKDIGDELGLSKADISHVFRGTCRSPRYVEAVYAYLGLEMPETNA